MPRFRPAAPFLAARRAAATDAAPTLRDLTLAAALVGAATMTLEISLTRLFSVLLFYHYVFLVLAIALLGLGLGGALAAALPDRARRAGDYAAGAATLAALVTVVATVAAARLLPPGSAVLHGAVAMLPFLGAGIAMPLILGARPHSSGRIYGADLGGAAFGAVLGFALLALGAVTAALGAAALFALAAWVVGRRAAAGRGGRALLLALAALLFGLNIVAQPLDVDLDRLARGKPLRGWLTQGQGGVLRSSWDPFGRVDVVASPNNPLDRLVFVDGAAGSPMPHYPADPNEETKRRTELGAFPYALIDAERTLVVGSGGGVGVLYALLAGVPEITAVEVSPGVIEAVRADGEYNGFLYDRPEVRVVTDEGRSFLERADGRYDVIDLSLVVSLATSQGGYALTENYLFTEEAFATVYDRLSDTGVAAVRLYDDPTLTRAFLTAATALRRVEPSDAAAVRHLAVLYNPREATRGSPAFYPLLLISRRPLTEPAAQELLSRAGGLGYTVMFAPFVAEEGPFGRVARGEASLTGIEAELRGGVFTPPTDAKPFFFEMMRGLPDQLVNAWIAVGVVAALAAVGLVLLTRAGVVSRPARRVGPSLGYFAVIGVAFMLVELALLARLSLFLGHPTVVVTVVLAALLLAGGVGSLASGRVSTGGLGKLLPAAAVAVALLAVVVPALLGPGTGTVAELPLAGRIAVALVALAPLGGAMGVLFPSGLRLAGSDATLPWAVNGVASVVGAVLATTLALEWGYPTVSLAGAALYAALALAGPALLGQPARWLRRASIARAGAADRSASGEPA